MAVTKTSRTIIPRGTSNPAFTQLTGVSATRSGTTATYTKTSHGLSTNDKVLIQGFSLEEFNGVFTITVVDANTFTATISADPGANPTGAPGTVDKATVGTAVNLSTALGLLVVGEIQNPTTGPTIAPQVWRGLASSSSEADYIWRQLMAGDTTANSMTPIIDQLGAQAMYVNYCVVRNTGQAVDVGIIGHELTTV